ncbi:MAG TPA: oligosaccharide flippase family protein [Stellaceae bacterium]|nr:oligosaccharide flippase family protein [Stellaceae bacterium]
MAIAAPSSHRLRSALNFSATWLSFIIRLVGQLGYFLLVARGLGPHDYGMVASVFALLIVFGSFSSWGSDHLMIRAVTAAPERFRDYFGNALAMTAATALPLGLLVFAAQSIAVGMAPLPFAAFALGELFFTRLLACSVGCFMAFERGGDLFAVNSFFSLMRLATCVAAILLSHPLTLEIWAQWYLAGVAFSGVAVIAYTVWRLGPPRWYVARHEIGLGFHFCLLYTADAAVRDIDKPIVAYFAGAAAAGIYNAAFRIVDAVTMPMRALAASFYARFFRHGHQGIERSFQFALKVLPITLGYAIFAGLMLTFGAQFLPLLLGEKFRAAAPVTGALALLPVFWGLTSLGGDILTSAGRQRSRALVMVCLSLSPVVLSCLLVPRFGAIGAAYASLGNAALVTATIWTLVLLSLRRAARADAPNAARAPV